MSNEEKKRIFYPVHKDLLDNLPPDIVVEMARRRYEQLKAIYGDRLEEVSNACCGD
jgi:hypothetical protein